MSTEARKSEKVTLSLVENLWTDGDGDEKGAAAAP